MPHLSRLALLALALLAGCSRPAGPVHRLGAALGTLPAPAPAAAAPAAPHGPRWLCARALGVPSGDASPAATRKALQALIDTSTAADPAVLDLSGGPWTVDRPLQADTDGLQIVGEGPGTVLRGVGSVTPLCIGVARRPVDPDAGGRAALGPADFVDLSGLLDASAAPAPGRRWGYALGQRNHLAFPASPFSHGRRRYWSTGCDAYRLTRQVTAEWACRIATSPWTPGPLMGLADERGGDPSPWLISVGSSSGGGGALPAVPGGGTQLMIDLRTAETDVPRRFFVPLPAGLTGVHRFAVQIDLVGAKVTAFLDKQQVAVTPSPAGPSWTPAANLRFRENAYSPFLVGAMGMRISSTGAPPEYIGNSFPNGGWSLNPTPANDRTILGLRVSNAAPYADDGPGKAQRRLDGGATDDAAAYFNPRPWTLALLPMDEAPDVIAADRSVPMTCGGLDADASTDRGYGHYMGAAHARSMQWSKGQSVRNLAVGRGAGYGCGIEVGQVINLTLRDVAAAGGTYGIGQPPYGSNYTIVLDGTTTATGNDAGLFFYFSEVKHVGLLELGGARYGVLTGGGSLLALDQVFSANCGDSMRALIRTSGDLSLNLANVDWESGVAPTLRAIVHCETYPDAPQGGTVHIRKLFTSGQSPTAPIVLLDEAPTGGNGAASPFAMDLLGTFGDPPAGAIATTGKGWQGTVRATQELAGPWLVNRAADGTGGIVVEHHYLAGPPRKGHWAAHGHRIVVDRPADGQFAELACPVGGTCGTATPPTWVGKAPLDLSGGALACYVQGNAAWTGGNAQPHAGSYSDAASATFLNAYLAGQAAKPPASLVAALATQPEGARPDGQWTELAMAGYARVPITFGASADGKAGNDGAVRFGPFAAAGPTATAVVLLDPAGNRVVAEVPIEPVTPANGLAMTFPAGILKVVPAPLPGPHVGGFANTVYDACNDFWLKGKAITPPTGLGLALSTAPASTTTPPAEPKGNGYARVPAGRFSPVRTGQVGGISQGWTANLQAATFPQPTGPWGRCRTLNLVDGAGNVLASAPLTIPRGYDAGDPPPRLAVGALWASW
jgi:hypothetical protein